MRLLLVDDDAGLRALLARAFARRGMGCRTAGTRDEALAAAAESVPEAVLCDVELGREDGVALCRELAGLVPGLRVVFMSGAPELLERAERSGLGPGLAKPFDVEEARRLLLG